MVMRWGKITVGQYQQLEQIQLIESDDIDKLAHSVCILWNKKPEEVNEWPAKKFLRYAEKVGKVFSSQPPRSWRELKLTTDATAINFGQFIEVMYFLQNGGIVPNLHHIAASLMGDAEGHTANAQKILDMGISRVLHPVSKFLESWEELIRSYSGLFEVDAEPEEDEEGKRIKRSAPHPFIEQYGWIFSATKLAEHERVKLDEVYNIGVLQALNGLAYLKSKAGYEKWLQKK